jgi:uncharacterized protein (DUF342 family)
METMEGLVTETKLPHYVRVAIKADQDPALILTVEPDAGASDFLTDEILQTIIKESGAETWHIDEGQIAKLHLEKGSLSSAKSFRIAERRDAQVKLDVTDGYREATITIVPPYGGQAVTEEQVMIALINMGVMQGVNEPLIPELVQKGQCEAVLIAECIPPEPGQDVRFEHLVQESEHKGHPDEAGKGRIDYRDLGLFMTVAKGAPLLRKIPPTQGKPGSAVDGSPIPSTMGRDEALLPGNGTELSKTDPNLVIASTDGLPVFIDAHTVKVVPKLELDGIDYKTGNIKFDGSVFIRGPIQAGFKVAAGGDIVAMDTVDASDFNAGGAIQFKCGVFGRRHCQISAKGNIKARFLNECTVYCGGNLEVEDLISNCTIICEGSVEVGKGLGKGQINGGKVLASKGIHAKILGSISGTSTVVEASPSPTLVAREQAVAEEIKQAERRLKDYELSLVHLQKSACGPMNPKTERIDSGLTTMRAKLKVLKEEQGELTAKLQAHIDAKIIAQVVQPGVTVAIGRQRQEIEIRQERFCYSLPSE